VPPVQVTLPELGLVGRQRVQRPARGDQRRVRADPVQGLLEGPVEFGPVTERLGLASDERLGPGRRRPGEEVRRASLRPRRAGRAADADLASLLRPPERQRGARVDGQIPALTARRAGGEVPAAFAIDVLADQHARRGVSPVVRGGQGHGVRRGNRVVPGRLEPAQEQGNRISRCRGRIEFRHPVREHPLGPEQFAQAWRLSRHRGAGV